MSYDEKTMAILKGGVCLMFVTFCFSAWQAVELLENIKGMY